MLRRGLLLAAGAAILAAAANTQRRGGRARAATSFDVTRTEAEWRTRLTPGQYSVLRGEGTEWPYSSPLLHELRPGRFACAGCDLDVFSSTTKFDSGTGWPSFWAPLDKAVATGGDSSGMMRTEVHCSRCGGHLGHVFADGPQPIGQRYCMNGVAMTFRAQTA